jgi:hypothetical protein
MAERFLLNRWRLTLLIGVALAAGAAAQGTGSHPSYERMKKDIFFLASPECEGRGVDTQGINKAADYIANQLKLAGLKPAGKDGTWFQPFEIAGGAARPSEASKVALTGRQERRPRLRKGFQGSAFLR